MNIAIKVLLGVLIVIGSFLILIATFQPRSPDVLRIGIVLESLLKYLAILITATSGLLLVGKGMKSASIAEMLPLTVPAVIGLLILTPQWSLGIYLSVLALGHFTRSIFAAKSGLTPPVVSSPNE